MKLRVLIVAVISLQTMSGGVWAQELETEPAEVPQSQRYRELAQKALDEMQNCDRLEALELAPISGFFDLQEREFAPRVENVVRACMEATRFPTNDIERTRIEARALRQLQRVDHILMPLFERRSEIEELERRRAEVAMRVDELPDELESSARVRKQLERCPKAREYARMYLVPALAARHPYLPPPSPQYVLDEVEECLHEVNRAAIHLAESHEAYGEQDDLVMWIGLFALLIAALGLMLYQHMASNRVIGTSMQLDNWRDMREEWGRSQIPRDAKLEALEARANDLIREVEREFEMGNTGYVDQMVSKVVEVRDSEGHLVFEGRVAALFDEVSRELDPEVSR